MNESLMNEGRTLSAILDIGEMLLRSGAEVMRVEDTISRLCSAYGFLRADVFTITSSIILTVHLPNGNVMTQTRRVRDRSTDLGMVAQLNNLSRKACEEKLSLLELQEETKKISERKPLPLSVSLICYAVISAAFSIFFGGNGRDSLTAAISGIVLCLSIGLLNKVRINIVIENMLCSAITAFAVSLLVKAGIGMHPDKIIIGNIMLLIPGIQLTTSLRDIFNGDMIAGLLGLSEAVLKALAIALGFAFVLIGMGG